MPFNNLSFKINSIKRNTYPKFVPIKYYYFETAGTYSKFFAIQYLGSSSTYPKFNAIGFWTLLCCIFFVKLVNNRTTVKSGIGNRNDNIMYSYLQEVLSNLFYISTERLVIKEEKKNYFIIKRFFSCSFFRAWKGSAF